MEDKKIENEKLQIIAKNNLKLIKSEKEIIRDDDKTIIINNNYLKMNNAQYMHFYKGAIKTFEKIEKEHIKNKSVKEIILEKGVELAVKQYGDALTNLTVADVAKDLKMGENLTNELFKRKDFPSVIIGKTKTVSLIAYYEWKSRHQESEVNVNE